MQSSLKFKVTLFIICFTILWMPLQKSFFVIDGAGRIITLFTLFALMLNWKYISRYCFRTPITYTLLLVLYMFISGIIHNTPIMYDEGFKGTFVMFGTLFIPIILMLLIVVLSHYDFDRTLKFVYLSIFIYGLLSMLNGKMEDVGGEGDRLMGITNSNEIALMLSIGFSLGIMLRVRQQLSLIFFCICELVLFALILATGSRMGFTMSVLVAAVSMLLMRKKNVSSTIFTILFLLIGYFIVTYLLENSIVGERFKGTTTQMEYATGTILDKFGDRGLQYYISWPYFMEKPLFGIGFHQWANYNPSGHVCHSEYLVQYLEGGIIGFVLYLLFFIGLIRKIYRCKYTYSDVDSRTSIVLFATMLSIIFANSVLWTFDSYGVFITYGFAYAMILNTKMNTSKNYNA